MSARSRTGLARCNPSCSVAFLRPFDDDNNALVSSHDHRPLFINSGYACMHTTVAAAAKRLTLIDHHPRTSHVCKDM
jgi:hypothetical protein